MRFNAPKAKGLYAEIAPIIIPNYDGSCKTALEATEDLIVYLETLITELGLPTTLIEMGITQDDLPKLASDAMKQTRLLVNNPCEVSESNALQIYEAAFA